MNRDDLDAAFVSRLILEVRLGIEPQNVEQGMSKAEVFWADSASNPAKYRQP